MNTAMRGTILSILSLGTVIATPAQFYPDSNAVWCLKNYSFDPGFDIQFCMDNDPDTLIMGRTYKKITEYNNLSGQWNFIDKHYVRNDYLTNRYGYVFILDSMAEYLTGDVEARTGDTVYGVLTYGSGSGRRLLDLVVDSSIVLTNMGVTVVRQYLNGGDYQGFFWQARTGTGYGPFLRITGLDATLPSCIMNNDTVMFYLYSNGRNGLPGGPRCCAPLRLGLDDRTDLTQTVLELSPNPAANRLTIRLDGMDARLAAQVRLFDATGKQAMAAAMRGPLLQLDVSRLNGLFMVVVDQGNQRFKGRVVIN